MLGQNKSCFCRHLCRSSDYLPSDINNHIITREPNGALPAQQKIYLSQYRGGLNCWWCPVDFHHGWLSSVRTLRSDLIIYFNKTRIYDWWWSSAHVMLWKNLSKLTQTDPELTSPLQSFIYTMIEDNEHVWLNIHIHNIWMLIQEEAGEEEWDELQSGGDAGARSIVSIRVRWMNEHVLVYKDSVSGWNRSWTCMIGQKWHMWL